VKTLPWLETSGIRIPKTQRDVTTLPSGTAPVKYAGKYLVQVFQDLTAGVNQRVGYSTVQGKCKRDVARPSRRQELIVLYGARMQKAGANVASILYFVAETLKRLCR
jgi:hypothetical protein